MKMKLKIGLAVLAGALAAVQAFGGVDPSDGFKVLKRDVVPSCGKIQLQSEGCGVEFRRVTLATLP